MAGKGYLKGNFTSVIPVNIILPRTNHSRMFVVSLAVFIAQASYFTLMLKRNYYVIFTANNMQKMIVLSEYNITHSPSH